MKICFLGCVDDLLRRNTGASIRVYFLAKSLAKIGHEVHVVIPMRKEKFEWADKVIVHGIRGLIPEHVLRFFSKLAGVSKASSLFLYDFSFILRSHHIILTSDIIQTEGATSSALITLLMKTIFKKPIIVDSHDTFQALRIKHHSTLRKILEIFLEKITYKHAKLILTVSEKDKKFLIDNGICSEKIVVISNGVDTEAFRPSPKATKVKTYYNVVFVGNMEYLPNQEAANLIVSQIAPSVAAQIDKVKFLMVGRVPPKFYTNTSHVVFTGVVDNVADFLQHADMAICPLLQGSGTRLKILEYFSCGLPVVSTSIGAEGLDVEDELNILVEDNIEKFANRIVDLFMNKELRVRLGRAARELAMKKYDWRIIGKQLDTVYRLISHN